MSRKLDSRTLGSLLRMASKGKSKGKRGRGEGWRGVWVGGVGGLGWGGGSMQTRKPVIKNLMACIHRLPHQSVKKHAERLCLY